MKYMFQKSTRNYEGIQFEDLRKEIDSKYNNIHDELSDCYYNKKPFRTYGVLTKEQFDKLHGLIFLLRDVAFHSENLKQPKAKRIPEAEYNEVRDKDGVLIEKVSERATKRIAESKLEGIELII